MLPVNGFMAVDNYLFEAYPRCRIHRRGGEDWRSNIQSKVKFGVRLQGEGRRRNSRAGISGRSVGSAETAGTIFPILSPSMYSTHSEAAAR
jgi:hypothetical protein